MPTLQVYKGVTPQYKTPVQIDDVAALVSAANEALENHYGDSVEMSWGRVKVEFTEPFSLADLQDGLATALKLSKG